MHASCTDPLVASSLLSRPTSSSAPGSTTTAMALAAGTYYRTVTRFATFHTLRRTLRGRLLVLYRVVEAEGAMPLFKIREVQKVSLLGRRVVGYEGLEITPH
jgi:hypothetical protein